MNNENTTGADDKQDLRQCLGTISDALVGYATKKVSQINSIAKDINGKLDTINGNFKNIPDRGDISQISEDVGNTLDEKLQEKLQDVHKNIDNTRGTLEGKIDAIDFDEDFDKLGGDIGRVSEKITAGFTEVYRNINGTRDNLSKKIDDKIQDVHNNIDSTRDIFSKTLTTIGGNVAEILRLQRKVESKLSETESQLADKQREIEALNAELQRVRGELKKANDEINSLHKDIGEKSGELTAANAERTSVEKSLSDWRAAAKIYVPVRNAMQKCPTFTDFLEQRGLTDDSEIGLFAFIQEIGRTRDFLSGVHSAALEAKKRQGNNPQPMTPDEVEVYEALNQCYRSIWEIDFDVFTTPGSRKSIAAPFEKTPFSREDATYFRDPRNRNLKFTKNIYVPLLLNEEGRMYIQAQVDAGNL